MKISKGILSLALLISPSVFANWTGDILCGNQGRKDGTFTADAKGRIEVLDGAESEENIAKVNLSQVRLFGKTGKLLYSKPLILSGEIDESGLLTESLPIDLDPKVSVVQSISFKFSPTNHGMSEVLSLKQNTYEMECVVHKD